MVLEVDGIVVMALVKAPFLQLTLVDGFYNNNNALILTLYKHQYIANTIIELFSSWFLVKGDNHCHFHTHFVIGIIFYG
jgi:hypothetical protein